MELGGGLRGAVVEAVLGDPLLVEDLQHLLVVGHLAVHREQRVLGDLMYPLHVLVARPVPVARCAGRGGARAMERSAIRVSGRCGGRARAADRLAARARAPRARAGSARAPIVSVATITPPLYLMPIALVPVTVGRSVFLRGSSAGCANILRREPSVRSSSRVSRALPQRAAGNCRSRPAREGQARGEDGGARARQPLGAAARRARGALRVVDRAGPADRHPPLARRRAPPVRPGLRGGLEGEGVGAGVDKGAGEAAGEDDALQRGRARRALLRAEAHLQPRRAARGPGQQLSAARAPAQARGRRRARGRRGRRRAGAPGQGAAQAAR